MGAECKCQTEKDNQVNALLAKHRGNSSSLIMVLAGIQEIEGYLPKETLVKVAEELNVPLGDVYGVATFYAAFALRPKGRHGVKLCQGTACYVKGANEILATLEKEMGIKPGQTTEDRRFSLDVVRCVGACGLAPVMIVDEEVFSRMTGDKVSQILAKFE